MLAEPASCSGSEGLRLGSEGQKVQHNGVERTRRMGGKERENGEWFGDRNGNGREGLERREAWSVAIVLIILRFRFHRGVSVSSFSVFWFLFCGEYLGKKKKEEGVRKVNLIRGLKLAPALEILCVYGFLLVQF